MVLAAGIPENPAVEAVIIAGLDLGPDLGRTVCGRPKREILIPGHDRGGILESGRSSLDVLERAIDRRIRMRVRAAESVGAGREVRWIDHWEHDVGAIDEHLPALSDTHVGRIGRVESEGVDRHRHPVRFERIAHAAELIVNHLRARTSMRERERCFTYHAIVIRKANVVELHFAEANVVRFTREIDPVLPHSRLCWIEPWMLVLVEPRLSIGTPLDRPFEPLSGE